MVQKIVGLLFILIGCSGLGIWYCVQMKRERNCLYEMCRILELMCGEIRYGRSTLPECCRQLSKRIAEPYAGCFYRIYEECCNNEGKSFEELSRTCMEEDLKEIVVSREDKERFVSCFSGDGFCDGAMQLRNIEQAKKELEDKLCECRKDSCARGRLAISLGIMSGLLLVILFL